MIDIFESRQQALENQFFEDKTTRVKLIARANKLFGLWLAGKLGKDEDASLEFAAEILALGKEKGAEAVINKGYELLKDAGLVEELEEAVYAYRKQVNHAEYQLSEFA